MSINKQAIQNHIDEFKPHSKPVMFRLLFLIYSRLKHKISMSVLQTCRNWGTKTSLPSFPIIKHDVILRHWALITETIAVWMTSKQNSPNYNSRGPWDKTLANDSPIFSLILGFKSFSIYEWSPPLNTPTLPSPSEKRRLWRQSEVQRYLSRVSITPSSYDDVMEMR